MLPQDPHYCRDERAAKYRRRRLSVLVLASVIALAGLIITGPGDAQIEGNRQTEASR